MTSSEGAPSRITEIASESPARGLARSLIKSLARGTAIAEGVRYIHVGHEGWLSSQDEILSEVAEDGYSETKFVRGAYGAGKSHFLSVVQDRARERKWCTSHIECKVDKVQIDRFETLYPKVAEKLLSKDILKIRADSADQNGPHPIRFLLERWVHEQLRAVGVRDEAISRPFDADRRLHARLQDGLLRSNLSPDFTRALAVFARATLAGDQETADAVVRWLSGVDERIILPAAYLQKIAPSGAVLGKPVIVRPIGKGTASEVMRGLLWLVRAAGYMGLVLCIDEVEELSKLGTRRRQDQALQALREYVDHAGGDGGYRHLCMYLAATPEMFDGPDYFPRYDALSTRIQAIGGDLSWRAPVIDLDRTPLDAKQMREMARRIELVYFCAYPEMFSVDREGEFARNVVDELVKTKIRIAKPRLLARVVVDELERARQCSNALAPDLMPKDIAALVSNAASQILKQSAS